MDPGVVQIVEALVAIATAILAILEHRKKARAIEHAVEVIQFFDPDVGAEILPPPAVPDRSWRMSPETRRFVMCGHPPQESAEIARQIAEAEEAGVAIYQIETPGRWYRIEHGLIRTAGDR